MAAGFLSGAMIGGGIGLSISRAGTANSFVVGLIGALIGGGISSAWGGGLFSGCGDVNWNGYAKGLAVGVAAGFAGGFTGGLLTPAQGLGFWGTVGVAAVSGMFGDLVGQSVGNIVGTQQGFDLKQTLKAGALSAITAGAAYWIVRAWSGGNATADAGRLANCFPTDTLVGTETGLRPIAQVEAGDRVWAYDFQGGIWRLGVVECRHDSQYDGPLMTLDVGVGEVTTTAYHPFWVIEGQDLERRPALRHVDVSEDRGESLPGRWVNSHDMRQGDVVYLRGCGPVTIRRIMQRHEKTAVCNLTVQGLHTFAVGEMQVLVHNTSGTSGPFEPRPGGTSPKGEFTRLQYELSQMAERGFTPTEIQIALRERVAQLDALARQQGLRVVADPYPNPVAGAWQVYQGQPILAGGNRPAIAIHGETGQVLVATTNDIRRLPTGEYGLFNFKPPKRPQ
jgi:hypothetical protein